MLWLACLLWMLWLAAAPLIFVLETTVARVLVAVAVAAAMLAAGRWLQPSTSLASGIALWIGS